MPSWYFSNLRCHLGNSYCPQLSSLITFVMNGCPLSGSTFQISIFYDYICQTSHLFCFTLPLPLSLPVSEFNSVIINCFGNKVTNHFLWLLHHIFANSYHTTLMLHYTPQREGDVQVHISYEFIAQPDHWANEPIFLVLPRA